MDLSNQKFGMLTVIRDAEPDPKGKKRYWVKCECGNEKVVQASNLRNGSSTSCGCYRQKVLQEIHLKHGQNRRGQRTSEYNMWSGMLKRCYNEKDKSFPNYGGRGITVYAPWKEDFKSYFAYIDSLSGYQEGYTIDRINNNWNYEPNNLRWASAQEQAENVRSNLNYTHEGETHCLKTWSKIKNLPYTTVYQRILSNWSFEKAISTPVLDKKKPAPLMFEYQGQQRNLGEISKLTNIPYARLQYRIYSGWTLEEALNPKHGNSK